MTTARELFEYALIELNKVQAPSLLLEDYNYFINKAIRQFINKVYNMYDVNQQKSDDIRVLKSTAILTPVIQSEYSKQSENSTLLHKSYELYLPDDYLHILNCLVEYDVNRTFKCYNAGDKMQFGAKRLTADAFSQIINNYYMRPSYKNPYYYINNINLNNTFLTTDNQIEVLANKYVLKGKSFTKNDTVLLVKPNGEELSIAGGKDFTSLETLNTKINELIPDSSTVVGEAVHIDDKLVSNVATTGNINLTKNPSASKIAEARYGNKSRVRMEIRYGKDNSLFSLSKVYIDYLKAPQFIRLTQEQVDRVEDTSQILEFPDYVCQEIVNDLVKILMENASDPRLQTHIPINQTIANPAQEQQRR